MFLLLYLILVVFPTRRHGLSYFSARLPLYHLCNAIFLLCSWKVQMFLPQLSFLHICSFSTNNNINDVLSKVTWPRLWVLKIARESTTHRAGLAGLKDAELRTALNYDYVFRVSADATKHGPGPGSREFSIFDMCFWTGTKLVLAKRTPPFGRLWRIMMRGENVVGGRGCLCLLYL